MITQFAASMTAAQGTPRLTCISSTPLLLQLKAKTDDLKSAYRQIPIKEDHLKYGYFCILNCENDTVEIYRSRTFPFGATHSVFSFLRLARMIHCRAAKGAKLITTNFHNDFILTSAPPLQDSVRNCMELIFLFTGWEYAKEGKKASCFAQVWNALGVSFDLKDSMDGILKVQNTEPRVAELVSFLEAVMERRSLNRHESQKLRGRLGFADYILHGRLGALILKRVIDHVYGHSSKIDDAMVAVFDLVKQRLETAGPKRVDVGTVNEWFLFIEASYEMDRGEGGLGGVLVDSHGKCKGWFSVKLDRDTCVLLGAGCKETVIYELELLGACLATSLWSKLLASACPLLYVDNDMFFMPLGSGELDRARLRRPSCNVASNWRWC